MSVHTDPAREPRAAAHSHDSDRANFATVWQMSQPTIARFVASRVGVQAAEDVVVDIYLEARRAYCGFDPSRSPGGPLPWLLGVTSNCIRKHRRVERRWLRELAAMDEISPQIEAGSSEGSERVSDPTLARALIRLPKNQREALMLSVIGELSYEEIAGALGVPIGTVRSRLHRAKSFLESVIDKERES